MAPKVSVIMPAHQQAAFIGGAVGSLFEQTEDDWELIVVDDGSRDRPERAIASFLDDARVRLHRLERNRGLGAACNVGLDLARAGAVAYLPADDRWDADHLRRALDALRAADALLVWNGMRHHGHEVTTDRLPDDGLQLVQVLHRHTDDRWLQRDWIESDDLERLFFGQLLDRGPIAATGAVTCTWTDHPAQRHKAMRDRDDGGLNVFRRRYRIDEPLRFHNRDGTDVDEVALYAGFRERRHPARRGDGLRILLVGDLGFNPERVTLLEDRGHELFGLWTEDPVGPLAVGPLPVGDVPDLDPWRWRAQIAELRPDVVYAQQNWRSVAIAHDVLTADLGVPFVWHFKEAPQRSIARGDWPRLAELVTGADACIFATPEERRWFELALPGRCAPSHVLDGDLPSATWGHGPAHQRLRDELGGAHVVCVGRPIGVDASFVAALADADVHLHLHGLIDAPGPGGHWRGWIERAGALAPDHLHVHPPLAPDRWRELSRYDVGLLHRVTSRNAGEIRDASWDDLNLPARIATYAAGGLPLAAPHQPGHRVAVQELIRRTGAGLLYDDAEGLAAALHGGDGERARAAMADRRHEFTFDHHVDALEHLLREVASCR